MIRRKVADFIWRLMQPYVEQYLLSTHKIYGNKDKVYISKQCNVNNALFNTASGNIIIEDFVFFGHNVLVLTGTHNFNKFGKERMDDIPLSGNDIIIKQGAWIASGAIILGPCTIGQNAVIAANAVVNHDVPANSIFGGVPAKLIKKIKGYDN